MKNVYAEVIVKERFKETKAIAVHDLKMPDLRARFAMEVLERLALIAGEDNGEDTAGRQKVRRSLPNELVSFACDLADKSFTEFEKRGWLLNIPCYEDIQEGA